ncbi:MAG TPA: DUF2652 domain-containing protein [Rhodothermia bacterium]|nr:DUF2652 domain-containing protein [Rhodothermia bacterium]
MQESAVLPTLIFIPDIGGFTKFVKQTEISHSQHIIQELLEVLIDANEIDLVVSEIEGDAVLFYRSGKTPTAGELLGQVQRMYTAFHAHLKRYEVLRICHCGACRSAGGLKLKFVAHYGDVALRKIKDYQKLFGEDVISAHRLLKNQVPLGEYALFTDSLMMACGTWSDVGQTAWSDPVSGDDEYDVGVIEYCYIPLEPLMARVPEPTVEDYSLPGVTTRILEHERVIEAPIELAFSVLADHSVRHKWLVYTDNVEDVNHAIAQTGSSHLCVRHGSEQNLRWFSYDFKYRDDVISFCETERDLGITVVYKLTKIGERLTRIQMNYLMERNPVKELIIKLFQYKKLMREAVANLDGLNDYCASIVSSGGEHRVQIVLQPEPR